MRSLFKGALAVLLCLSMLVSCCCQAVSPSDYSTATPQNLEPGHLYGRSCILINADNGEVLFEKDADERRYPASTTKIMTAIIAIEWAQDNGMLESTITIPNNIAVSSDSSKMGLSVGDRMTFIDLLYGMMLASGNDAALAVAMLVSGSTAEFVKLMNAKAEQLGLSSRSTHFSNVHGLHEVNHYTTARDLAAITRYAMQNETFREIVRCVEYTIKSDYWPDGKTFTTRYDLLLPSSNLYYEPCIGVKTGYTNSAGRCFVGAAEMNGITLISVSLNPVKIDEADKSYVEAFTDTIRMFKYGFLQYSFLSFKDMCALCDSSQLSVQVGKASENDPNAGWLELSITDIPSGYTEGYLKSDLDDPARLSEITSDFAGRIRIEFANNEVVAPLAAGDVIGRAYFTGTDGAVYEGAVASSRDVEMQPPTMDEMVDEWLDEHASWLKPLSPRHNPAAWLIYVFLAALILFIVISYSVKKRRRNKARRAAYERKKREYLRRMQREEYLRKHPEARQGTAPSGPKKKPQDKNTSR